MDWDTFITGIITGISAGIGSTIGAWIVNKAILRRVEQVEEKLRNGKTNKLVSEPEPSST